MIVAVAATLIVAGVAVARVESEASDRTLQRWSDIGQAFGTLGAVASVVGVVLLLATVVAQICELRAQRDELAIQRGLLDQVKCELHHTAEAEYRSLHTELVKLALHDGELAAVWPPFAGTTNEQNRQYLYANLILQTTWLQLQLGICGDAEMRSNLRYLLASPVIRAYWRDTAASRRSIYVRGTPEFLLAEAADAICAEYEAVLACADGGGRRS